MYWMILSLGSGVLTTLSAAYSKRVLSEGTFEDWNVILARFLYVLPLFVVIWALEGMSIHVKEPQLFGAELMLLVIVETISQYTYHQALKHSEFIVVMPFQSLTPLFVIPLVYMWFGELPSLFGVIGICMVLFGILCLQFRKNKNNIQLSSDILKQKGVQFMLCTAFLWSITTTLQKMAAQEGGVAFFGVCYTGGVVLTTLVWQTIRGISPLPVLRFTGGPDILFVGFLAGIGTFAQYTAITLAHPAYVNALRRVGLSSNLLIGKYFFQEHMDRWMLTGNILTVVGVVLIVLS